MEPEKAPAGLTSFSQVITTLTGQTPPTRRQLLLKVISGQKLVLESAAASSNDKLYAYCTSANDVDAIASVLEDVS